LSGRRGAGSFARFAKALINNYLVRVFVDVDRTPEEVVTAYRTSKIEKYRSQP